MIRKINNVIVILLVFLVSPLFSKDILYHGDLGTSVSMSENTLIQVGKFEKEKHEYSISVNEEGPFTYIQNLDTKEKWLSLISDELLFMYNSENTDPIFWGVNKNYISSTELIIYSSDFLSSSYLVEGETTYYPKFLGDTGLEKLWVEGVPDHGIGETISFSKPILVENLYLSNGYVSYRKPYLYCYNSRVKKIRMTDELDDSFEMIFNLDDTPNPQKIDLESKEVRKLIIEIQDIYPGSKWDDTCINFILVEL